MAEEQKPARPVLHGTVLPMATDGLRMPPAPLGIAFLAEARNWSERKQLESFEKLAVAKNRLISLMDEQQRLLTQLARTRQESLAQIESLDDIREVEKLKVKGELARAKKLLELDSLSLSVEIEEAHVRLADARRRRKALEEPEPPREPAKAQGPADRILSRLNEIREVDRALRAERERWVAERGGESNLSDEDRQQLERLELLQRAEVERMYEELT